MVITLQRGFRSSVRLCRRSPGHVGLVVVILGLGMGATTADGRGRGA
jgi:hypothetical protein